MEIDSGVAWVLRGLAAILAVGLGLWTGLVPIIQALMVLMVLDVVSGFLSAFINSTLSSDVSLRGMAKKAMVLLLVTMAAWLQPLVGLDALDDLVTGFFIAHEGLSILENAANAGLPIPAVLRAALAKLNPETERETVPG